ncbi:MAG: hypothetical protein ACRCXZ_00395 [Patescibacteria group bacterium]
MPSRRHDISKGHSGPDTTQYMSFFLFIMLFCIACGLVCALASFKISAFIMFAATIGCALMLWHLQTIQVQNNLDKAKKRLLDSE